MKFLLFLFQQIERFEQSHLDNEVEPYLPWEELNYRNWKYSYNMIWTGIVTSILVFWWVSVSILNIIIDFHVLPDIFFYISLVFKLTDDSPKVFT